MIDTKTGEARLGKNVTGNDLNLLTTLIRNLLDNLFGTTHRGNNIETNDLSQVFYFFYLHVFIAFFVVKYAWRQSIQDLTINFPPENHNRDTSSQNIASNNFDRHPQF
jgi:hypothetical protein